MRSKTPAQTPIAVSSLDCLAGLAYCMHGMPSPRLTLAVLSSIASRGPPSQRAARPCPPPPQPTGAQKLSLLSRVTRTVPVLRVLRTAAEIRPVVPARVSSAEVRVDLLPVHLPGAVRAPAPLHLTRAVVRHVLVGGDALVEEQTSLALHDRASEGNRLARCAGLLVPGAGVGVDLQSFH